MAPPLKRKADSYDKNDGFVDDSDSDEASAAPPSKRSKPGQSNGPSANEAKQDEEGNPYWEISRARRVMIQDFKGKKMVSIREFYEKDSKWLPGKKGITMTIDQYSALLAVVPQIEHALSGLGETVPRPKYGGGAVGATDDASEDSADAIDASKKANHEATSDEGG